MKKGMDRKKFEIAIRKAIYLIEGSETQEAIIDQLVKRGYNRAIASDIVEGNAQLGIFSPTELGVIADTIYTIAEIPEANIERFLEEAEINIVKSYKIRQETEDEDLLVFEDVRQVADDIWTVVVPCKKIAQLYRNHAVRYDFETQRNPKMIKVGDSIIKEANVNSFAVAEIQDLLVRGVFIPNTITFNVPSEKADNIKFDKSKNKLILLDKVLTILDGYHRSLGIVGALRENPNLNYNFEMRITCFDTDKARQFIVQEDKRNPINKEYIKSIDESDKITVIVNRLNQDNKSELQGKIATDSTIITSGDALVSFDIMNSTIDRLWKPTTAVDGDRIFEYLRSFFNELVDVYPNELKLHIKESRKFSYINKESMFVLYLVMAKAIEKDENWKNTLRNSLSKLDIENEVINEFINTPPSIIKHNINSYIKTANNIIEGVLKNERQVV